MNMEQMPKVVEDTLSAFRKHRHDVLNVLQMVRAYIQMDRQEKAIKTIDIAAKWIQSLSLWQTRFGMSGERLTWVAAECPHVILSEALDVGNLSGKTLNELERFLRTLEHITSEFAVSPIEIALVGHQSSKVASQSIGVRLMADESQKMELMERLAEACACTYVNVI